jgi:sugar phosphate isomerase/epimerase
MRPDQLQDRLGLNVPYGWWPAAQLVKSFEAAGFSWVQVSSPPESVLASPRDCAAHARAGDGALGTTDLEAIVHGPASLRVGSPTADRAFEGLLAYAAEIGARQVVYHACDLAEGPASEDLLLAETRSLSRLAARAERLGVTIAVENLCPVFPGPDRLSHSPLLLRSLVRRVSSPAVGLCLDIGHAHVVADLRHADAEQLIRPVLDCVVLVHVHDNFGARRGGGGGPELDPLRLDLHLPPGRGTLPWGRLAPLLGREGFPLLLEVHPPHRPHPSVLYEETVRLISGAAAAKAAAGSSASRP